MTLSKIKCMGASALVFLACAGAGLAVPANDDFASIEELGQGLEVTVDNTGGTIESGEPTPSGFSAATYQATSWWHFTPPGFEDNWYVVETTGSSVDTVLAIWTGDDFASPLSLVHVNDEAIEGGVSRIRFFASPSITYKISVASRGAARGTVKLKASASGTPFAEVTGGSFSVTSPDTGPGSVSLNALVTVEGSKEVTSGLFTLFDPSGGVVTTVPFSGSTHRSGTVAFGTYTIPFSIPMNSVAGAYRWSFQMNTTAVTSVPISSFGWDGLTPFPSGTAMVLNVQNSGPPDLYALWVTQNSLAGADALKDADPDKDGVKNVLEYASGLNPQVSSRDEVLTTDGAITRLGLPRIRVVGTGDSRRLRVEFVRRLDDLSIAYTVQFSDNLVGWEDAVQSTTLVATDGVTYEVVAVEDVVAVPAKLKRQARLQVVR